MRCYALSVALVLAWAPVWTPGELPAASQQSAPLTFAAERDALHNSPDWALIAPHLPDPATATAAQLETAADVLRARRFPEDAMDYYGYALARGGDVSELLNKMGVVQLEIGQVDLARALFLRTLRAHKKDATAWNNLGVADYADRQYISAISEYKHACKLNRRSAVFHSNLGLAYLELGDSGRARAEFIRALALDPTIMMSRDNGGTTVHLVGAHNFGGFCLEMAALYARKHETEGMLSWLARAGDAGLNLREAVRSEPALRAYAKDSRVQLLIENQALLRARSVAATRPPSLGQAR